jgi:selenide, water dikinase
MTPGTKDIVLIGAGHAHVGVLRAAGIAPIEGARVTLITRGTHTPYSGMLPGLIAGHYSFADAHIDIEPLARFANATFLNCGVTGLDTVNKLVICADRPPVSYDILSINIGSTPGAHDVPGASDYAIPVKPIDGFLAHWADARKHILETPGPVRIGIVGGGAGGVELILAVHHKLKRDLDGLGRDPRSVTFILLAASTELLPAFPAQVRRRFAEVMTERGIAVKTGARVMRVAERAVTLDTGTIVPIDVLFWTTRAAAAPWLDHSGLSLTDDGFISVRPTLQSVSHPDVFAAGDVASISGHPTAKSGVYAVRSAAPLTQNLRRMIAGHVLRPYRPQRETLSLVSTGDAYAVGSRNGLTIEGAWVWHLKDWIDRRFMARYQKLP